MAPAGTGSEGAAPHPFAALGTEPIRTIGRDELQAKLERGDDFRLVMALNRWAFEAKHIPGSLHFDTPDELYAALKPEDEIVVYCSNVDCLSSVAMYRDLVRRGYQDVRRYSGGLKAAYLFGAFVLASPIGLMMALVPDPIYDFYVDAPRLWGLSPILAQQIAGALR